MSDLDVSLRLRLVNQLSRPAEEAERDLKELRDAAERLGRTRGGEQLGRDIDQLGRKATEAKTKLGTVGSEAQQLREKLGRLNNTGGLEGLKVDANQAKAALGNVGVEAQQLREKLGRLDDTGGLEGVKADADKAKAALRNVGVEAQQLREKLGRLDDTGGLEGVKADADKANNALGNVGAEAQQLREKIGRLNNTGGLDGLKQDADKAKSAIDRVGQAATEAKAKIDALDRADRGLSHDPYRGIRQGNVVQPSPDASRRHGRDARDGFIDRSGLDVLMPAGATSAGYLMGGAAGAAAVGTGYAYKRYAADDRETEYTFMNMDVPASETPARRRQLRDVVRDARVPYAYGTRGLDALGAANVPIDEAMSILPAILKTSLASNADPVDVARTAQILTTKMNIAPKDLQGALDRVVAGGNMGQFEVPDMAKELPNILTYAKINGFSGMGDLEKVLALMQAGAQSSGGNAQAASTNLQNIFAKMHSEETEKNFADYGVNLPAEYKKGRAAGKDDIDILYSASMKASKGGKDQDALGRLFTDMQAFLGLQALVSEEGRAKINSVKSGFGNVDGTVERQWERVANDPQAAIVSLGNAADRAAVAIGGLADKLGLTHQLEETAKSIDAFVEDPKKFIWDNTFGGLQMPLKPRGGVEPDGDHREQSMDDWLDPSNVKRALGTDMGAEANQSMGGYLDRTKEILGNVAQVISSEVASWKAMLDFTAGPTIQPTLLPPSSAPGGVAPQKQSSLQPGGGTQIGSITQNISSPHSQMAARRAQREQDRAIRMAQWNAIGETGSAYG